MTLEALCAAILRGEYAWGAKRLSSNDIGLTQSHQAGVYLPAFFVRQVFAGTFDGESTLNPRFAVRYEVVGREGERFGPLQVIHYNNKRFGTGTRDEFRVTGWRRNSGMRFDADAFDCIFLMAVSRRDPGQAVMFVARTAADEKALRDALGLPPLAPKDFFSSESDPGRKRLPFPDEWRTVFPSSTELSAYVFERLAPWKRGCDVDALLLMRRELEERLFMEVEAVHTADPLRKGFADMKAFSDFALTVLNRRKARSGKSLENNLSALFRAEGVRFSANAVTELHKRPDFLFPSIEAYRDLSFPDSRLCMMGAKTSCKDRWRQILSEADRIASPYLFTLDTALSETQVAEMEAARVRLVMPAPLVGELRWAGIGKITTLREFVDWRLWEQTR